ncbi:uncharacterized protein L201_003832 [Kwoniella dendrophila CBS 6074]|uniref:Amino acid permease/ SLC12A domain-containing protein n=1 Tax=Kwoniella dendrophila CBS 6074 TaxID=1295534 RepID=A0AAX4JWD8_9TREE
MSFNTYGNDQEKNMDNKENDANVYAADVERIPRSNSSNGMEVEIDQDGAHLDRTLSERQVTMLAIAGIIGTGLFLGTGRAIVHGGAVGAWLGYFVMAILSFCMMMSLGEMSCHQPSSGNFVAFTSAYVNDALGSACGWIYFMFGALFAPVEISAACVILQYWDKNTSHASIYTAVLIVFVITANAIGVRWFGEIEFWFGFIKVATILGLILVGIVINAGGGPVKDHIGFRIWKEYPFNDEYGGISNVNTARFLGFWAVLTQAAFSFSGLESLAVVAGEAKNPRKVMARAFKQVFQRIAVLYLLSLFIISLNVSRVDPNLLGALAEASGTAAQSPFVIMINRAGIKALPAIINAVVFTSAISSGNEGFFFGSRTLVALATRGHAPRFLLRTNRLGSPYFTVIVQGCFACLSFLSVSNGSATAFSWLSNLTTLCSLISWICICVAYIRFHKATVVQGFDRKLLPFRGYFQPYLAWFALVGFFLVTLFNVAHLQRDHTRK